MVCRPVLFYVSVDNDVRCKYCLTKSELNILEEWSDKTNSSVSKTNISEQKGTESVIFEETHILVIKPFAEELLSSECYRNGVYNNLSKKIRCHTKHFGTVTDAIVFKVTMADSYVIDYAWGWRLWRQCHLGLERECASAWLSTLGGAFSALGDYFSRCAKMALRISMQQIKLSVMGGDPDGVARGWLFLALALSQLGHGNAAFRLLRLAYNTPSYDDRHHCMCLGVQAKLKYDRKIRRQNRVKGVRSSGDSLAQVLRSITL